MSRLSRFCCALSALFLAACATAPTQAPTLRAGDFAMTGRVLIRQSDRADVLRINWAHLGPADTVRLETSLGQTVAEISLTPQRAHVRLGDGREFEAADDASLAREVVGVPVPLRRFAGWLRAEPGAGATGVLYDDAGRVSAMGEAGWQLNYSGYGALEAVPGPSLIEARKEDVVVRVKIETWSRGSDE